MRHLFAALDLCSSKMYGHIGFAVYALALRHQKPARDVVLTELLGEDHPSALRTASNLVEVLHDLDRDDQADALQAWIANAAKPQSHQPGATWRVPQ